MNRPDIILAAKIYPLKVLYDGDEMAFISRFKGLFANFYNTEDVENIISNKERCSKYFKIIKKAEEISFYEHERAKENPYLNLMSVFSRVSIDKDERNKKKTFYIFKEDPVSSNPLSIERCAPSDSFNHYLLKFEAEVEGLTEHLPKNREDFEVAFDRILYKYLWCVASSRNEGEDISLFDHMKVMTAITYCLLENKEHFLFGICDFSGIQKYIFSVASTNTGGVSKRLRARSFYVDLLIRTFARYVVDEFKVGFENILLETGGKFYVLLPAKANHEEILTNIRDEIESFLFDEYKGQVSINFAWDIITGKDLENYSGVITRLTNILKEKKNSSFSGIIKSIELNEWIEEAFVLENDLQDKHICNSCKSVLINKSAEICPGCKNHYKIGEILPKTKFLIYSRKDSKGKYRVFRNYYVEFARQLTPENIDGAYLIEALKDLRDESLASLPIKRIFMANFVPEGENGVLSFSEIAEKSVGAKHLAVLKMDVDTLGYVFSDGLSDIDRHYGTISRIGTMSRLLNVFFCGRIQRLLEGEYPNIYSVFSGGDDLFLIGPWNEIPKLAIKINSEFRKFTGQNRDLTISAGISIFGVKEHITRMAEICEEELEDAKNSSGMLPYQNHRGRNRVKFLGDVFSWEDFEEAQKMANMYSNLLSGGKISSNILRRLIKYSKMYKEFIKGDTEALKFVPLLHYDKKRNYPHPRGKNPSEDVVWFDEYTNRLLTEASITKKDMNDILKELFFTESIVKWALNLSKGDR